MAIAYPPGIFDVSGGIMVTVMKLIATDIAIENGTAPIGQFIPAALALKRCVEAQPSSTLKLPEVKSCRTGGVAQELRPKVARD